MSLILSHSYQLHLSLLLPNPLTVLCPSGRCSAWHANSFSRYGIDGIDCRSQLSTSNSKIIQWTYSSFPNTERFDLPFIPYRILEGMKPWIIEVTQPPVCSMLNANLQNRMTMSVIYCNQANVTFTFRWFGDCMDLNVISKCSRTEDAIASRA